MPLSPPWHSPATRRAIPSRSRRPESARPGELLVRQRDRVGALSEHEARRGRAGAPRAIREVLAGPHEMPAGAARASPPGHRELALSQCHDGIREARVLAGVAQSRQRLPA